VIRKKYLVQRSQIIIIAKNLVHTEIEERYYCLGKIGENIVTVHFTYKNNKFRINYEKVTYEEALENYNNKNRDYIIMYPDHGYYTVKVDNYNFPETGIFLLTTNFCDSTFTRKMYFIKQEAVRGGRHVN
jgi:hypothetical protein